MYEYIVLTAFKITVKERLSPDVVPAKHITDCSKHVLHVYMSKLWQRSLNNWLVYFLHIEV